MKKKKCEYCGIVFIPRTKTVRFCGQSCAAKYGNNLHPKISKIKVMKICMVCNKEFQARIKDQRFCGTSCSAKWRMSQPEIRKAVFSLERSKKMSLSMKENYRQNPDRAKQTSIRMSLNNPSKNPETVAKTKAHWAEFGHPIMKQRLIGGNGCPLPKAQRILWAALGPQWKTEYPIPTKKPRESGYPTCYKADIALPEHKIWIEIDGWSHNLPDRMQQDKKKEELLMTLGWKGLRFSNQEVMNNLKGVLSIIYKFLDTLHITLMDS